MDPLQLNTLIADVTENLDKYELGIAVQKVYDFIWDSYCDWYIELTKSRLYGEDEGEQARGAEGAALCARSDPAPDAPRSCRLSPRRSGRRSRTRATR